MRGKTKVSLEGREKADAELVNFGLEPKSHRKPLKGLHKGMM